MIITHHPLLFRPLKRATESDRVGWLLLLLARHDISLFSAHTNLDFTQGGVSEALAIKIGLGNRAVLSPEARTLSKIIVFVPNDHVENVRQAMSGAGAGHVGNYDMCSFHLEGSGTFRGLPGAQPFVGRAGILERVAETRLEMIVQSWNVEPALSAMRRAHPYEEVAYDVYRLENRGDRYGAGVVGELDRPVTLAAFLRHLRRSLGSDVLRYTGELRKKIKRVAVCGGSGSDLLGSAILSHADAYVTADVRYHTFQDAEGDIALIDAGHFETEAPVLPSIQAYLRTAIARRRERVEIALSQRQHNPVHSHTS